MSDSNLVKNSTIYALGDIIPRILTFISFPILTTYLTPVDYGIINYVNTVNILLLILSILGLNTYYLVYYYRVEGTLEKEKLLGNLSIFIFILNVILSCVLFVAGPFIMNILQSNIDFYPYVAIGVAMNFFNVLGVLPSALYRVQERPWMLTILNILKGIFTFSLTIIMVVVFKYTALGVLWSNFIVASFFGFIFIIITIKNITWNINLKQIRHALIFSLPLLPGSLSYYLITMSDRILIDKYLTLNDLGIYSTAATLALLLNILAYGAYKAFEPYLFKIYGSENFVSKFIKLRDIYVFVLLFGVLGLAYFSKEFFQIFANYRFSTSYLYVPLILLGVYSSAISMLYSTVITAKGQTKINSLITIVGGVCSVSLNILLLKYGGIWAASVISAFSLSGVLFLSILYAKVTISHIKPILASLVAAVSIWVMVYVLEDINFLKLILYKIIALTGVMIIIMYLLRINPRQLVKNRKEVA